MPRLATYLIPDPGNSFYRLGCAILGYDIFTEQDVPLPAMLEPLRPELRNWVGPAHQYGFHATIGDALEYAPGQVGEIEERLAWIASRIKPFRLTNGRMYTGFRGFPRTLVGTFDNPDGDLYRLEEMVVTMINPLYDASPVFGDREDSLTDLQRIQLLRFGSPNVRSLFDLHFSLATGLPDAETRDQLQRAVVDDLGLFSTPDQQEMGVDRIYLVEQRPGGRFGIRAIYQLGR